MYESKAYSHASLSSLNYTDKLQFIGMQEGRARYKETDNSFRYDYMLKDHLGNVRMLLTEEQEANQYPAATLETATISSEEIYYGNLSNTQYNKPGWFTDPLYGTNAKVARVKNEGGSQKIGPNMVLKVMAGDSYNIRVASGWSSGSAATNSPTDVLSNLLTILSDGVAGASGGKVTSGYLQSGSSGLNAALTTFMNNQTTSGTKPKAYISWILLDEQFKVAKDGSGNIIAGGYSGFEQVGASGVATIHTKTDLTVAKSGYLYIYTSNEATNIDVFFDNLQVTHTRGPILEETHYYPFGLTMAGISSKALAFGTPQNRYKFNDGTELANGEFSDGTGLEIYETTFRGYDPQVGRFWQIDPKAEVDHEMSPFVYVRNNPVLLNDPLGLEPDSIPKPAGTEQYKSLEPVIVSASYKKSDYLNILNANRPSPSLLSFFNPFSTRIMVTGNDFNNASNVFSNTEHLVNTPHYLQFLLYLENKIKKGGKMTFSEKKFLWWLRKTGRAIDPLSKRLGVLSFLLDIASNMKEYKDGNISGARMAYRAYGSILALGTPGAIIAAGGSTGVGLLAGIGVAIVWGAGEYLYDEIIEPKIIEPIKQNVVKPLSDLERDLRNWKPF